MIKIVLLLICFLALANARRSSRIIHGRKVSERDARGIFGFVAQIGTCDSNGECGSCTGSLIRPDRVLFAAHCLCKGRVNFKVFVQTTKASNGKSMTGKLLWKAPYKCGDNAGYQVDNDIALIQLDRPLHGVNPVPIECRKVRPGTEVTMIGFGGDHEGGFGILQYGTRRTMQCDKSSPDAICVDETGRKETATDFGDSGGPLLIKKGGRYYQVGVVNGGITLSWEENGKKVSKSTGRWSTTHKHCQRLLN